MRFFYKFFQSKTYNFFETLHINLTTPLSINNFLWNFESINIYKFFTTTSILITPKATEDMVNFQGFRQ